VGDLGGGRKYLVLGPGKNRGYHRAGRVGVSTGGRPRWGRINISVVRRPTGAAPDDGASYYGMSGMGRLYIISYRE
jgi:hypothetical protein